LPTFFYFVFNFCVTLVDLIDTLQSFVYRPATASSEITYDNSNIPLSTPSSSYP